MFSKRILSTLLILIGLSLFIGQFILSDILQPEMLKRASVSADSLDAASIQTNIQKDIESEPVDVGNLPIWSLASSVDLEHVVGYIAIPTVDLYLPILAGATKVNLSVAATTIKKDQRMGVRNYALAGHLSRQKETLFSPLHRVVLGELIYLTDKTDVFVYIVDKIIVVLPDQVEVIEDQGQKKLLTLVTCEDSQAKKRRIIIAHLSTSEPYNPQKYTMFQTKYEEK